MSPRSKKIRKVFSPPPIKGFKPYGPDTDLSKVGKVSLLIEEYEVLRLCDYDMYNHHEASQIMNISRPTYTRIYASARRKLAKAFVEGLQITIEGGKVYFDSDWYNCHGCGCSFNNPEKEKPIEECPLCGSNAISKYSDEQNEDMPINDCRDDFCVCMKCGFEKRHRLGYPCKDEICPNCQSVMSRKRRTKSKI
jgi:predicted DNA-binding protein (UPF0251 family)